MIIVIKVVTLFCKDQVGSSEKPYVLFMCEGRKSEDVKPFFDFVKEYGNQDNIKAMSTDFTCSYTSASKDIDFKFIHEPDEFHGCKRFGKMASRLKNIEALILKLKADLIEVLKLKKRGRTTIIKKLKKLYVSEEEISNIEENYLNLDETEYRINSSLINSERFALNLGMKGFLLKNFDEKYKEVILSNSVLNKVLQLGDKFRFLWHGSNSPEESEQCINEIKEICLNFKSRSAKAFVRFIDRFRSSLVNACIYKISNSTIEGINSECKVIQRSMRGIKSVNLYIAKIFRHFRIRRQPSLCKL